MGLMAKTWITKQLSRWLDWTWIAKLKVAREDGETFWRGYDEYSSSIYSATPINVDRMCFHWVLNMNDSLGL